MRRAVLLGLLLAGCSDPEPAPAPAPAPVVVSGDRPPEVGPSTTDPWPRYRRAKWFEAHGDHEEAIAEYGACINLLPAHHATRPVLDLGKLHQMLGHPEAAERCFREVLDTFPERPEGYVSNPDFREAALGLSPILAARGADLERQGLRERFLDQLGGTPEAWTAGPSWTKPPAPPPSPPPAPR